MPTGPKHAPRLSGIVLLALEKRKLGLVISIGIDMYRVNCRGEFLGSLITIIEERHRPMHVHMVNARLVEVGIDVKKTAMRTGRNENRSQ
jgi:hypothetical protein